MHSPPSGQAAHGKITSAQFLGTRLSTGHALSVPSGAAWSAIPVPAPPPAWRRAVRTYSRPTSRTASHAAVLLSAFAMCRAFPGPDSYADSATPRLRQPASGLAGPPAATRRLRGASHVHCDPFDRVGSRLYPCSASEEQSQRLPGHRAPIGTGPKRPAVFKGTVVAASSPCPPGLGLLCESRGFYHRFAFALPFGLACTRAGVWQYRPAVTLSGLLPPLGARSHTTAAPSFSGPLHQPGAGIPAGTDRDVVRSDPSPFTQRLVAH